MTTVISNQSRATTDLALLRETASKQSEASGKALQRGAAKVDAGLVELVGRVAIAGAARLSGASNQVRLPHVELASPRLSADMPQTRQEVLDGLRREQENQSRLAQDPGMAVAVGTLLQHFTTTPRGREAQQEGRQTERTTEIASAGMGAASRQAVSLFGNGAAERAFSVILKVANALQDARHSELELQGRMTVVQRDAAIAGADAIRAQGQAMLTGAISSGVLQGTLTVAGAIQQFRGLNTRASSIENELKPKAELQRFDRGQSFELRGKNMPVLGDDGGSQLEVTQEGGSSVRHSIERSGDRLNAEHTQVLGQDRAARQHRSEMHGINHQSNEILVGRQQTTGSLLDTSAVIAKNQAEAISGMQQSNARAHQTLEQNAEQVAGVASNAHQENAQKMRELTQKLHDVAVQVNNAQASVADQVASSLKI